MKGEEIKKRNKPIEKKEKKVFKKKFRFQTEFGQVKVDAELSFGNIEVELGKPIVSVSMAIKKAILELNGEESKKRILLFSAGRSLIASRPIIEEDNDK